MAANPYTVTVEGVDYDVDAPDEKTAWKWARATHLRERSQPQASAANVGATAEQTADATTAEKIAGSGPVRFALGAASPVFAADQLLEKGAQAIGIPDKYSPFGVLSQARKDVAPMVEAGRKASGSEGMDFYELAGSFLSPAALAALKIAPAATAVGRIAQGAGIGAGFGALTPVENEDNFAKSKAEQVGTGAALGGAVTAAIPPIGRVIGYVTDFLTGGASATNAGKILRSAAGKDLPAIKAALAAAPNDLTATQAVAGIKNDTWNALGELVASKDVDSYFSRLSARQKQDMVDAIRKISVGANQTEARQAVEASSKALKQITTPMREAELAAANAASVKPIDTTKLVGNLTAKLNEPSIAGNKVAERVIDDVAQSISQWTEKGGGVIDAEALYAIRKNAVNSQIETMMGNADPKIKAKYAASLLTKIKPAIDDAIVNAGGTGWRDYLTTFEKGMRQIEQQQMGAKALDLIERQPKKLVSLAAGNEPKMVEKVFKTEYDFAAAMGDKAKPINEAAANIARDIEIKEGAKRGAGGLERILRENSIDFILPNWIDAKISITNRLLRTLEERVNKSTVEKVYAAMRNGQTARAALSVLPAKDRIPVINAMVMSRAQPAASLGVMAGQANE